MGKNKLNTAKPNVVKYILDIRERLREAMLLATSHATTEQSRSHVCYDRKAKLRSFEPGKKVLALLPFPGKHLQVKYYGPCIVLEKLGPVDYLIETPDRRKTQRVCHINLLKLYKERDKMFAGDAHNSVDNENLINVNVVSVTSLTVTSPIAVVDDIPQDAFKHLVGTPQQEQLERVLCKFKDVISDK